MSSPSTLLRKYVSKFSLFVLGIYRAVLDSMGATVEVAKYTEKLVPSTRFVSVDGVAPTTGTNNFVAPSASVIGSVKLGEHSRYAAGHSPFHCNFLLCNFSYLHFILPFAYFP